MTGLGGMMGSASAMLVGSVRADEDATFGAIERSEETTETEAAYRGNAGPAAIRITHSNHAETYTSGGSLGKHLRIGSQPCHARRRRRGSFWTGVLQSLRVRIGQRGSFNRKAGGGGGVNTAKKRFWHA